jgi:hypothetical protein
MFTNATTAMTDVPSTSPSANPSNKDRAAYVLKSRLFEFNKIKTKERLRELVTKTFEEVWNRFVELIRSISKIEPNEFRCYNHGRAKKRFLEVMRGDYGIEDNFMEALMGLLQETLREVGTNVESPVKTLEVARTSDFSWFQLGDSNIGFASSVNRSSCLKFGNNFGISKGSKTDISVVVVTDINQRDIVVDTTAGVELKLGETSTEDYPLNSKKGPDLEISHAPLCQGLFYTNDTFYCLARRGIKPTKGLPVVILAARRKKKDSEKLCCMKGGLAIPKTLGDPFQYHIDRCVKFPESVVNAVDEPEYIEAITIFIDTLCTGLEYAQLLSESDNTPLTLCSLAPRTDLILLASPIPKAKRIHADWSVHQGELYGCNVSTFVKDWLPLLRDKKDFKTFLFTDQDEEMDKTIVKLSCVSVHPALIPISECCVALEKIHRDGTPVMKSALAKVLLAYAHFEKKCLLVVMKDRSQGVDPNRITPSVRWKAFRRLVETVFCPMAELDIVHADIRFDPTSKKMCNIVYFEENSTIEMAFIDFESLTVYPEGTHFEHMYAIAHEDVPLDRTAFKFLFFQVLWSAYVWTKDLMEETAASFAESICTDFHSLRNYLPSLSLGEIDDLKAHFARVSEHNFPTKVHEILCAANVLNKLFIT